MIGAPLGQEGHSGLAHRAVDGRRPGFAPHVSRIERIGKETRNARRAEGQGLQRRDEARDSLMWTRRYPRHEVERPHCLALEPRSELILRP